MSLSTKELKNSQFQAILEDRGHCQFSIDIHVSKEKCADLRKQAIKEINKAVEIAGFRKGKAPDSLILKHHEKHVDREEREIVIRAAYVEVLRHFKLQPLNDRSTHVKKFEKEENGETHILIDVECYPILPVIPIDSIQLEPVAEKPVLDRDIEGAIEEIRRFHASWHDITDRGALDGDFATIDIEVLDTPPFKAYENSRFHLTSQGTPDWARKALLGLTPGESVEVTSEKTERDNDSFVPKPCRITLLNLQRADLPEMDDDLAKKAGGNTVDDLKEKIRHTFKVQKEEEVRNEVRHQLKEQLLALCPFDLPHSVTSDLEARVKSFIESTKGSDLGKDEERTASTLAMAFGNLKISYLLPELAHLLKVPHPTEKEIGNEFLQFQIARFRQTGTVEPLPEDEQEAKIREIERELYFQKTFDALAEKLQNRKT